MMHSFAGIVRSNTLVISFVHPLVFFLMGFSIFLKNKTYSRFHLTKSLKYIGMFGVIHSFADWGDLFIPLQSSALSVASLSALESMQSILSALSFAFLLYFGLHLLHHSHHISKKFLIIPPTVFSLWLAIFYLTKVSVSHELVTSVWVSFSETLADYVIAIPAALVSAAAIYLQKTQFEQMNMSFMKRFLLFTAISIITYTASDTVLRFYGSTFVMPIDSTSIELFRSLDGAVTGILILKILQVVDIEYHRYLVEAQRNKLLTDERNRIARDLHDGMIQSLYAFGLELDTIRYSMEKSDEKIQHRSGARLRKMTERINGLIAEIRGYINELITPLGESPGLEARIKGLIENVAKPAELKIEFLYTYLGPEPPLGITLHLFYIIKEALSNVVRHSRATEACVSVSLRDAELVLQIVDNGVGLQCDTLHSENGMGISNIYYRADAIGGKCNVASITEGGTAVEVRVHTNRLEADRTDER